MDMGKPVRHGIWVIIGLLVAFIPIVGVSWLFISNPFIHAEHIAHGMNQSGVYDLPMSDIIPETGESTLYGIPLTLENTQQFLEWYYTLDLSPAEEVTRNKALQQLVAPCCDDYTMLTCCCECNLAYSVWGLTAYLAKSGYSSEDILKSYEQWLHFIRPDYYVARAMEAENIPIVLYGLNLDQSCYIDRCDEPFLTKIDGNYYGGCSGMGNAFVKGNKPTEH